jgi:hypothetical protein
LLKNKVEKIRKGAKFINSANTSLNAIALTSDISVYINDIGKLSNPTNNELGFSLFREVDKILKETIIKGKKKINKSSSTKFMKVVKNIINNPITNAVSKTYPVVGSIKSVVNLVLNTSIRGNDIKTEEINEFYSKIQVYIDHYEGLYEAQSELSERVSSINVRIDALTIILENYTEERILTLYTKKIANEVEENSLNANINTYLDAYRVEYEIRDIYQESDSNIIKLLNDNRLTYPHYAQNQAKFIRDEIEALSNEYYTALRSYNEKTISVLENSKNFGVSSSINKQIEKLEKQFSRAVKSYYDAVNLPKLKNDFNSLGAL